MSDWYKDKFGTSFGFNLSSSKKGRIVNGVTTDGHSYRDFGLFPAEKPVIEPAKVDEHYVEVPGMDGRIDMTESLDGVVHYKTRKGSFRFISIGREKWDAAFQMLKSRLHGKKTKIVVDEDPSGYYVGRLAVEKPSYNSKNTKAYFDVSGNLEPYKYDFTLTDEDWLWDPFSFENGVIREYGNIAIDGTLDYTIIGSDIPVTPDIKLLSGSVTVTFTGHTGNPITLRSGSNIDQLYELILRDNATITLHFAGSGTVAISYETGWL